MLRPQDTDHRFTGSVYAIIGPGTFSCASVFAQVLKDYRIGALVGEETGGLRQFFCDMASFTMPNSNLQFSVSMKRLHAPIARPGDATRGSVPDVQITEHCLVPFMDSVDPELAYVLDLVATRDLMQSDGNGGRRLTSMKTD